MISVNRYSPSTCFESVQLTVKALLAFTSRSARPAACITTQSISSKFIISNSFLKTNSQLTKRDIHRVSLNFIGSPLLVTQPTRPYFLSCFHSFIHHFHFLLIIKAQPPSPRFSRDPSRSWLRELHRGVFRGPRRTSEHIYDGYCSLGRVGTEYFTRNKG